MCRSFGYKRARRLGHIHLKGGIHIAPSGVQKHFHTILGSRDISKTIWGIRLEESEKSIVFKSDIAVIYA